MSDECIGCNMEPGGKVYKTCPIHGPDQHPDIEDPPEYSCTDGPLVEMEWGEDGVEEVFGEPESDESADVDDMLALLDHQEGRSQPTVSEVFPELSSAKLNALFRRVFESEIMQLREAGQREYAREDANAFANFNRVAKDLDLHPTQVLWVYARKHMDGVVSWIQGHRSQREDVRGRINDLIVYLFILRAMVDEMSPASEPSE